MNQALKLCVLNLQNDQYYRVIEIRFYILAFKH